MKTLLLLTFASFLVMSCSLGPTVSPTASDGEANKAFSMKQGDGLSNVFVRRVNGGLGTLPISVDGEKVGVLANDTYIHLRMSPGTYRTSDHFNVLPKMRIVVNQKDNILVECLFTPNGFSDSDRQNIPKVAANITSSKDKYSMGHCWIIKNKSELIRSRLKDDDLLQASKAVFYPDGYKEYPRVKQTNTVAAYQQFIKAHSNSNYTSDARKRIAVIHKKEEDQRRETWAKLSREQKCKVKQKGWVYIDSSCKGAYANGLGRAVYEDRRHSFKGTINNGRFVKGKYLVNGELLFDGAFVDDAPNGSGICIYKNEPEECKYYQGKRVDSLYKQRQEIAAMEQRQKKEMDKLRGEIRNSNNQRVNVNTGKSDKTLEDKLIDSAIDKGMDKLFDHLF